MRNKRARKKQSGNQIFIDSFVFKFFTKSLIGFFIITVFLTLSQCTIKKPQSPQWNTNFIVPIINRTYTMEELINKIDGGALNIEGNGNVAFNVTEPLDTFSLSQDLLTTQDLTIDAAESLGVVVIESPSTNPVYISLSTLTSGYSTPLPGDSLIVPARSFNLLNNFPSFSEFSSAVIANGQVLAIVNNNLGIQINNVVVQIYDVSRAVYVTTSEFSAPIASGTIDTLTIVLDGKTISNSLRMITWFNTSAGTVSSASTRSIGTNIKFADNLTVSEAVAEVPAFQKSQSFTFELLENDIIKSASLNNGNLHIRLYNGTAVPASITVIIPEISKLGQPLSVNRFINANQIVVVDINLAGYYFNPADTSLPQEVACQLIVDIPESAPTKYNFNKNSLFSVSATISDLSYNSISGIFASTDININSSDVTLDIPIGLDSVQFANVSIYLEIVNTIDLPGSINIQIYGSNGKGLTLSGNINPDGTTTISKNDSTVSSFIYPIPDVISVTGLATFGEAGYNGTIQANDFVTASVTITAPMQVVINETQIETDIENKEIDQNDFDLVTEHIKNANFIYEVANNIPIGARVNLFLSNDSASLFSNPGLDIGPLYINAAPVDSLGLSTGVAFTDEQIISLDSNDIKILENPFIFIGQEVYIESTDGQMISLNQDGYITITGRIEIEYFFNGEF